MSNEVTTDRLILRDWSVEDADAALEIFGSGDVTHWLTPAMDRVADIPAMRDLLREWQDERDDLLTPRGRWAVQRREDGVVIGGLSITTLPPGEDLQISWQLNPAQWGKGYAAEASHALLNWAFTQDTDELFAVARPNNKRAIATAKRLGLQWVGETSKYYGLNLQVYRIRPADMPA
jgi:RimJ/RimL family protein N-acetyltransferase